MIVNILFLFVVLLTVGAAMLFLFKSRRKNGEVRKEDFKDVLSITGIGVVIEAVAFAMIKFILKC